MTIPVAKNKGLFENIARQEEFLSTWIRAQPQFEDYEKVSYMNCTINSLIWSSETGSPGRETGGREIYTRNGPIMYFTCNLKELILLGKQATFSTLYNEK